MEQQKIGSFIATCRKEKQLTQKELANQLGVSDKSVSKWERGICLPDASLYLELCKILHISMNELFAGERIETSNLIKQSEENILNIVTTETKRKNKLKKTICLLSIFIFLLIGMLFYSYHYLSSQFTVAKTYEYNWNLQLPTDFKELYHTNSGPSFHGDGERYTIFSGNSFFLSFQTEKNKNLEQELTNLYQTLQIPTSNQMDFSHSYSWKKMTQPQDDRNYMYCIYDFETQQYYFFEFFF